MKKRISSIVAMMAALALLISVVPMQEAKASTLMHGDAKIEYVESIDNMQYPGTDKYWTINDFEGFMKFTLSEPTMVKAYLKWDTQVAQNVVIEYTRDREGLDVIGKSTELRESGSFVIHLLDAGEYYMHYKFKPVTEELRYTYLQSGMCILGQRLNSNEQVPVSSMASPNKLTNNSLIRGALSITAPIDYYTFTIPKKSNVSLAFNFDTFNDFNNSYGGNLSLYDSDGNKIANQAFNSYSSDGNVLTKELEAGKYYVTLSGMETSTSLKFTYEEVPDSIEYRPSYAEMKVKYVSAIDNAQYPSTSQFSTAAGTSGVRKITTKYPAIIKIYLTWDTEAFSNAQVWISRDRDGIDRIGQLEYFSSTTSYVLHLLDPGTYYVNYELGGGYNTKGNELAGICVLGQKVKTTETNYVSSFKKPTLMKSNKKQKGFLSLTAPVDYYKFTIDETSNVKFTFNFATIEGKAPYDGVFTLYTKSKEYIYSQTFNTNGISNNTFTLHLNKGSYFIVMNGPETYTTVKYKAYSTNVDFKETKLDNGSVKLSFKSEVSFKEVFMRPGKESKLTLTDASKWNAYSEGCSVVEGKSVIIKKNGYYSFRMLDSLGNYYLKTVKVKGCKN